MSINYDRTLRNRIIDHMTAIVAAAPFESDPFPHVLIRGFFPKDVYERMLASLPPRTCYEDFSYEKHQTDGQSNRHRFQMNNEQLDQLDGPLRTFWYTIRAALGSPALKSAVFDKVSPGLAHRYGIRAEAARSLPGFALPELFHEAKGYSIKPHPDTRKKVVTMQIALPRDESQRDLGTEFYRRSFNPLALLRDPRGFDIAKHMPFLPNTAYAFAVLNTLTLKSWHGKSTIPAELGERNSILNIWYEKAENANTDLVAEWRSEATRGVRAA